jgi:hypothetical protein
MLNFTYKDDLKIKNKHVAGISRTFYLSIETIRRPTHSQSRETILLNETGYEFNECVCCASTVDSFRNLEVLACKKCLMKSYEHVSMRIKLPVIDF